MHIEKKAIQRITKEVKVLTISEEEFKAIAEQAVKRCIKTDTDMPNTLRLFLAMNYAHLAGEIHMKLFSAEEENNGKD